MPELPEVEHLRRTLEPALLGRTVHAAHLLRRSICQGPRTPRDLLEGARIDRLIRHGKQLAIIARDDRGDPTLCVHLGMSGRLTVAHEQPSSCRARHIHAWWSLADNSGHVSFLAFADPRRFGGLWTFTGESALRRDRWAALGPDALSITPDQLRSALARARRPIKAALLDQALVAGVDNIYADESLFAAGIHPTTAAASLRPASVDRLAHAIRSILARAIEAGGSTRRDYVDALGRPGRAQEAHAVYGRAALPCVACGHLLASGTIAQRTTVWCPSCQPE